MSITIFGFIWFLVLGTFSFPKKAAAINLQDIGTRDSSIQEMWGRITAVFPHTDLGAGGLTFAVLRVTQFLLLLIGSVAVAVLVYAGITLISSAGSDEKVSEAKKMALYALLGVALAIVADVVVLYVAAAVTVAAGG